MESNHSQIKCQAGPKEMAEGGLDNDVLKRHVMNA